MACIVIRPIAFVDQLSVIDRRYRSDEAAKGANHIRILLAQRRPAIADPFACIARYFAKIKIRAMTGNALRRKAFRAFRGNNPNDRNAYLIVTESKRSF
ncbi:hypothetical protein [Candidatus Erwinia dacicola]|uniref:hypothetical protein n=1 Tax=Candidatus Erwinia dacicola TaxID=252393 RepID=UPI0013922FC6|nr:hypothetical protein [Candidatus Erwinia dacicola]NJC99820.1 hypothetical protein [Candidatus Erwinia dacicola]NJD85193.1 hypothetical protein [Candidatus Erwinia dacicola]